METRGDIYSFPPIALPNAQVLILGSYPSPKSFAAGFYYAHPQNRFWPLLAALTGADTPTNTPAKIELLLKNRLALWDSLACCQIRGSSDVSIANPVPNDIAGLISATSIEAVFCNGAAAHKYYQRFGQLQTGITATPLPSTSPANASFSFKRLLAAWQPLGERLDYESPSDH